MRFQVRPPSSVHTSVTIPCSLRHRSCQRAGECRRIVGWMAPNSLGSFRAALRDHERADASASSVQPPAERKRSRYATQPVCSVLVPASSSPPPGRSTGFARIGPRIPSGSFAAADHVRPPSDETRTSAHQARGLRPTL